MNTIRDDFPKDVKDFFKRLENYLDTELYFYGSVNRSDYIHGKSDIDIAIFTDNEYSVISQLQHFLHVKRNAFDKIVWRLQGEMNYGYKIKCGKYIDINCEIAIYNNDFKESILARMKKNNEVPFYAAIIIYILKTMHYTIPILSEKIYTKLKNYVFNEMVNKNDTLFFLMKQT
jgi:predicted nucleotidyltransferase